MNDKPAFSIQIQPNFSDIRHAYRLYRASMASESYDLGPAFGVMCMVGGGFVLFYLIMSFPESLVTSRPWWSLFGLFALGVLFLLDTFPSFQLWRAFRHNKEYYSSPYTVVFEDDQIAFQGQKRDAQSKWSLFTACVEGRDEFILVYGKGLYHYFPKKAFQSDAEIAAFRDFVKEKTPTFKQKLKIFLDFKK